MPAVVDPQGRVADLSQCPLKRSRPVRRGRAATGSGAEQEIVWSEAVLVAPSLKQADELTRDRTAAGAGLGLAGLIERYIDLVYAAATPASLREVTRPGTYQQHLQRAKHGERGEHITK